MSIKLSSHGDFSTTEKFLGRKFPGDFRKKLDIYGKQGVEALKSVTPVDTGVTANSWEYEIAEGPGEVKLIFRNTSLTDAGIPVIVLLHYGHGTRYGGYVMGRDFINPAIQPIFDELADDAWKEVTKK